MAFLSMSDELIEVLQANFRNNGFDIDIHPGILWLTSLSISAPSYTYPFNFFEATLHVQSGVSMGAIP